MVKKGDTLIEVTMAVGIFSMIAIAIASVMSGGTAGAQAALETTLAREEIDAQAEALRFIHTAYTIDRGSTNDKFPKLWQEITQRAVNSDPQNSGKVDEQLLQYNPSQCDDLYKDDGEANTYGFVLDLAKLGNFSSSDGDVEIIKRNDQTNGPPNLSTTTTYPRLVYNNPLQPTALIDTSSQNYFYRAEGIYIIAIKDIDNTNNTRSEGGAFYDFYIRTCWYGSNANEPTTISTVMRLYEPQYVESNPNQ